MINLIHLQQQSDRRARRYAQYDAVPREIARRMAERLDLIRCQPTRVLDLGCGPGRELNALQQRYPQAQLLGLDVSAGHLRQFHRATPPLQRWLRAWTGTQPSGIHAIQADGAHLPLRNSSVDLLYSNLALQYKPQPHTVFPEWARVLAPGGLLMFSTLGPDSLQELRAIGLTDAIFPFVDMHDLGDMLVEAGFSTPVMDMEKLTLTYKSAIDLFNELHALGGNCLAARGHGLHTPRQYRCWQQALAQGAPADGRLHLTLEVVYGHAWRAQPTSRLRGDAGGRDWVGVPLTEIRGRKK
jgi:malonyl-CoA O-methyltransferase